MRGKKKNRSVKYLVILLNFTVQNKEGIPYSGNKYRFLYIESNSIHLGIFIFYFKIFLKHYRTVVFVFGRDCLPYS